MISETIVQHVADTLKMDINTVRAINFYKDGDTTHFNQTLDEFYFDRVWSETLSTSEYTQRRLAVDNFNKFNKYKKRGIAMLPTKYGLGFTAKFLNQAGALIHVYTDGSVLITHGGVEIGQGLHTKSFYLLIKLNFSDADCFKGIWDTSF